MNELVDTPTLQKWNDFRSKNSRMLREQCILEKNI